LRGIDGMLKLKSKSVDVALETGRFRIIPSRNDYGRAGDRHHHKGKAESDSKIAHG
jgi:hypothetical protein